MDPKNDLGYMLGKAIAIVIAACATSVILALTIKFIVWVLMQDKTARYLHLKGESMSLFNKGDRVRIVNSPVGRHVSVASTYGLTCSLKECLR